MPKRLSRRKVLAKKRAEELMETAFKIAVRDLQLADRYVELARKLCMRARVRLPRRLKRYICRGCKRLLYPNLTARFRISPKGWLVTTCARCGHIYRVPLNDK